MKHYFPLATLIVTMCITPSLLAQQNGFRITAINEAPGRTMDAGLFATTAPETTKKYMPTGNAPASVSSFVLFAGEDTILFDTGNGGELWVKTLTDLGVKPESVTLILLTHTHGDHTGGLLQGNTRRFPNAKLLCAVPEYEHWLPQNVSATSLPGRIKTAYGQSFTTFKFGDEVFANAEVKIKALDAAGHTPGHTVFLIEPKDTAKEKMLIFGDLLHAAALQFPVPEACARFDMNHEKAIASRKMILDFAAQENIHVAGMHLPSPSVGTVKKNGQGGYDWEPNKP